MEGLTYQDVLSIAQSWDAFYFLTIFIIVCVYAFWPANKAKFEKAAAMALHDDETAP